MKFLHALISVSLLSATMSATFGCSSPDVPEFEDQDRANNTADSGTQNNTVAHDDAGNTPDTDTPDTAFVRPTVCEDHDVCGPGWLCDLENARCVEGFNGTHGVYEDRLVLGFVGDTSGATGEVGRNLVAGINTYFKHMNTSRGGVHGRELELKVYNNGGDPILGATLVNRALENREVFAFIGNQGDGLAELTVASFNEKRVVLFAPTSGGSAVRRTPPDRFVFNYRVSYAEENARMVDYFVNENIPPFPAVNVALFTETEPTQTLGALGQSALDGVSQTLSAEPHRIPADAVHRATYVRGSTNVDAAVESMMRWLASPDRYPITYLGFPNQILAIIVVSAHDQQAGAFIKAFKDDLARLRAGLPLTYQLTPEEIERVLSAHPLYAVGSAAGNALAQDLKASGPEKYCVSATPGRSDIILSQMVPFYESNGTTIMRYREQLALYGGGLAPGFTSLESYIATRLLVEALDRAGAALTDDHFVDSIESITSYGELALAPSPIDMADHQAMTEVFGTYLDETCTIRPHEGSAERR